MTREGQKSITSFRDLEVCQKTYKACIEVMVKIIPNLPDSGKFDLKKQLSSSVKAIQRLIAEGSAKRHQEHGFQKYLDDAMVKTDEVILSLSHARELYQNYMYPKLYENLIGI